MSENPDEDCDSAILKIEKGGAAARATKPGDMAGAIIKNHAGPTMTCVISGLQPTAALAGTIARA